MSDQHYVFAGGGTGGHLYPGLAVADALQRRCPAARITFFTTSRPLDRELLGRTGYAQVPQVVRPFTLHPLRMPGFLWAWWRSVAWARSWLYAVRPHAVLGLGGYAAGPPVVAARQLGLRTAILNPDAIPGRANRHLARQVDRVFLQWPVTQQHLPAGAPCVTVGCPIRPAFATPDAAAGRAHFGLAPDRPVLLVTGASQGARTVNDLAVRVWPAFARSFPEWQLLHLAGPADEAAVRAAYAAAGVPAQVLAFTHDMPLALAAADVVVARAGASTLAELTALGRPAILLPYPYHRDRHQHANGQVLVDCGAAFLIEDHRDATTDEPALRAALTTLAQPAARARMAEAARALGRPHAADDVANWLAESASVGVTASRHQ